MRTCQVAAVVGPRCRGTCRTPCRGQVQPCRSARGVARLISPGSASHPGLCGGQRWYLTVGSGPTATSMSWSSKTRWCSDWRFGGGHALDFARLPHSGCADRIGRVSGDATPHLVSSCLPCTGSARRVRQQRDKRTQRFPGSIERLGRHVGTGDTATSATGRRQTDTGGQQPHRYDHAHRPGAEQHASRAHPRDGELFV